MARLTESERLVALETKVDLIIEQQKSMNTKLDAVLPTYVNQIDHNEDISFLKKEISEIRSKRWIQNTLSAILGAVLTLLVAFFIANVGR